MIEHKLIAGIIGAARWPQWAKPKQSTTILLATCLTVLIGAWRHGNTQARRNPLQQEVWIEWLSWAIIFAVQRAFDVSATATDTYIPQTPTFWTSRFALTSACVAAVASQLSSSQGIFPGTFPLITILVTTIARYSPVSIEPEDKDTEGTNTHSASSYGSSSSENTKERLGLPAAISLNLICFALFFHYDEAITNQMLILNSFLFLLTRSCAIILISKIRPAASFEQDSLACGSTMQCLGLLSMPILAILTLVLVVVRPNLEMSSLEVLGHALAQAVWWSAVIILIRLQLPNTVANLDTLGFSAELAITGSSMTSVIKALCATLVCVIQSVVVARPGPATGRAIFVLVVVFVLGLWIRQDPRLTITQSSNTSPFIGHPIEDLITHHRARFASMISSQSKTADEAVVEYQRRYGRRPPWGFHEWFNLAKENNFVLIDEFDTFMESMEPFHGVHPSILKQRIDQVLKSDAGRMVVIEFTDKNVTMSDNMRDIGDRLTNKTWLDIVPYNMTVILNGWDEPMVNAPWDEVEQAIHDAKDYDRPAQKQKIKQTNVSPLIETGKQNGWAATARACSIHSPSRQLECPRRQLTAPIPFISNATSSKDVCQNCELLQEEGLLVSPGNMKVAHELFPIWSASKPSHFHDILYPSAYYIGVRGDYRPKMDMPWEDKDNKFYWVGRATGGWATLESWDKMQRQNLVLKTMDTNPEPIQLLEETEPGSNKWTPRYSTMAEVADFFSTRIADVVQCTDEACKVEKEAFGLDKDIPNDSQDAAYSHRFVMDIDGNGFSGRFYRLLQSRSVVVKQTILKEWHDDRLIPWVHYVPVSTGYDELPEMARFLASTDRGLELSERIARESTSWHNKALRDVDLQLVFLRMLLEYGRVMNPEMTA